MREVILNAKHNGDSVGGEVQTVVTGVPAGVGEPWFDSVESVISHAIFSIGGVKGIEFGSGFEFCKMVGSQANDEFYFDTSVKTKTNHNGGINGGITNGMPIVFNTAIKPTPSIFKEQNTVDYKNLSNQTLNLKGRHDPCIAPRIRAVIDSMTAITLCDLLVRRFGEGYFCSTL
jgi:chorismate synthase